MSIDSIKNSYKEAMSCNACFKNSELIRGKVKRAQPRWIGEDYFKANKKICVLLINPGDVGQKSKFLQQQASIEFENLIEGFHEGTVSWEEVMLFILKDMPNWGQGSKYIKLYFEHLKLPIKEIAFLNVMLCSANKLDPRGEPKNYYGQQTMSQCFQLHTKGIMEALDPDICILSGTAVWEFARRNNLESFFPNCEFKYIGHYAARGHDWNKAVNTAHVISNELQLCPVV